MNGVKKTRGICVGASSGGHANELLKILENSRIISEKVRFTVTTLQVLCDKLAEYGEVTITGECNRFNPFLSLIILFKTFCFTIKNRPGVIITTGALPLAMLCFWGKLFGAKIIWIDSIANIHRFSMSGRFVYRFADLFITQWPQLAEKHEKAFYYGELI